MKHVQSDKYLGQFVEADGSNSINIEDKYNKGIGMSCQVLSLLSEISLGHYYFDTGLLLRDTNIVNVILFGAEALYGITKKQIEILHSVDLHFLRKLFNASLSTAKEAFHLETGKIPVAFTLVSRRLMFWRHIVSNDTSSLLFKFYNIQKSCRVKNDWVVQIEKDKNEIGLSLSDEDVATMSKWRFKKLLRQKIRDAALQHLNNQALAHSKSIALVKTELKCEDYITDTRFSVSEVQLLFRLRTRTFPVKENLKNKYRDDLSCEFCRIGYSTQQHQLECPVIKKFVPELAEQQCNYSDIFGTVEDQLRIVKTYSEISRRREILLESMSLK